MTTLIHSTASRWCHHRQLSIVALRRPKLYGGWPKSLPSKWGPWPLGRGTAEASASRAFIPIRDTLLFPINPFTCGMFQTDPLPASLPSFVEPVQALTERVAGVNFKMSDYFKKNKTEDNFCFNVKYLAFVLHWIQVEKDLQFNVLLCCQHLGINLGKSNIWIYLLYTFIKCLSCESTFVSALFWNSL